MCTNAQLQLFNVPYIAISKLIAQVCSCSGMKYYGALYSTRSDDEENAIILFIQETAGLLYSEVVRGMQQVRRLGLFAGGVINHRDAFSSQHVQETPYDTAINLVLSAIKRIYKTEKMAQSLGGFVG